jgi:YD repeat-containing protein
MTRLSISNFHRSPLTAYAYNAQGLLGQVTDPLGNVSQVAYDFTGRVSSVEQSCGGTTALRSYATAGLTDLSVIGYDAVAGSVKQVRNAETQSSKRPRFPLLAPSTRDNGLVRQPAGC